MQCCLLLNRFRNLNLFRPSTFFPCIVYKRTVYDDSRLSKREYWRERYDWDKQVQIDWLVDADRVSKNLEPKIRQLHKETGEICLNILDLGCGTSDLPAVLLKRCKTPLIMYCVDYSEGAIQWQKGLLANLNQRHGNLLSNYRLVMADVCQLPFQDDFFHVVIDKGTSDSLLKSKDGHQLAESSTAEIFRVLHPAGTLWQITDEDPDVRLLFLQSLCHKVHKTYSTSFEVLFSNSINDYFLYTTSREDSHGQT